MGCGTRVPHALIGVAVHEERPISARIQDDPGGIIERNNRRLVRVRVGGSRRNERLGLCNSFISGCLDRGDCRCGKVVFHVRRIRQGVVGAVKNRRLPSGRNRDLDREMIGTDVRSGFKGQGSYLVGHEYNIERQAEPAAHDQPSGSI